MTERTVGEDRFWRVAETLLARSDVSRSTMMGLPCLRVNGAFFASCDRKTGDLLVKLPEATVNKLIASGRAMPFAPAGRRFKAWAAVPAASSRTWKTHLTQAYDYVAAQPPPKPRNKQ